jgi:AhpD family alkylhydroperoxidase
MTPRIAPGGLREAGPFAWGFAQVAGLVTRTNAPHLFLTMGRQHKLFRGWLRFAGRLMPGGSLPRRETELVILRVAHRRGCAYEFEHHVRLGRRAGVDDQDVKRIQRDDVDEWPARERTLLAAADALVASRDLDDAQWTALRAELSEAELIEFLLLVGHYDMLATFLNTLRVEPDRRR